jgi:diguanylate cyclase (GGDEF)-like protein
MNNLKEGVSLRKIHNWLIVIVVLLSCLLIYTTYRVTSSFMHVKNASEENIALGNAVHGLMDASDYLTEMVQRFAVTGDSRFMDQYYFEAFASKRREQALAELKKNQNATEVLEHLQEAMRHSVKLMDREYYAMRLVIEAKGLKKFPDMLKGVTLSSEDAALSPEAKMQRATNMVLGEDYYVEKNRIRTEVQKSVRLVEKMTEKAQTEAMVSYQIELNLARAGIVLNIMAILFVVWLTSSLGINPILKAVDQIKSDSPIQENGANEFRYLAKAYNNLYSVYKKSIEHLNFKASHDELTGAYNRAGFDLLLSGLDMNTTYVLSFDVDDFKTVNDTYGHDVGDKVLQKVVQVLKGSFRSDDYVCRLGGDEFVVFMVHTNELQRKLIKAKMEQISQELANTDDGLPQVSVSVGIVHGSQATDAETLLKMGDAAMYESKKHGKNTFTFYS